MLKLFLYILVMPLCIFAFDGVNFNKIIKSSKEYQIKIFYIFLVFGLSYLVVNFVCDFVGVIN